MPHELPPLPYAENALEPHIADDALRVHRQVHASDVERLNRTLERTRFADPPIAEAIARDIGSLDRLVDRMSRAALGIVGSGWAWLVHDDSRLAVTVTRDNDNPVMGGQVPLLALDMWEHAHLPQRGRDRRAHVEAFWPLVDWEAVARRLAGA